MRIRVDPTALKHSRWYGHVLRFALGGVITVAAGLVAKVSGPAVGGFLLAFPAILPAALILLRRAQNEELRARSTGARGRRAVVLTATGAAVGSLGLAAFAFVAWCALGGTRSWLVLVLAMLAWALVAGVAWAARKRLGRNRTLERT
jgi:hypothetical protein